MKTIKLIVIASLILTTAALAKTEEAGKIEKKEVSTNIFSQSNDMVFLQLTNPSNSKIRIAILDQKGEVLHEEIIKEDLEILKRYDISKLPSGVYSYKVSNDSFTVVKKIEKK